MKQKLRLRIFGMMTVMLCQFNSYAQNLLDMTGWAIGTGTSGVFTMAGTSSESSREWGNGPDGNPAILWTSKPSGDSSYDGGWISQAFPIVHTQMYRFTIWMKKTNSKNGASYLGCSPVLSLAGTLNNNPYFFGADLPLVDRWYLLVGYIHGSGDTSTTHFGAIYDGVTGAKVSSLTDYKFATTATTSLHRSFLYGDLELNDRQYHYAPRVDLVNGNEPTITALLGFQAGVTDQSYFSGNVGVGTTDTKGYKLAVAGSMIAESVKVKLQGAWPDFVFAKDYKLPSLQETENHIKEKGHLPGIPSAAEVEKNGVELGDMNKKLLQKIEELTLYLIEQKNESELQKKESELQKQKITALSNKVERLEKDRKP